MIPKPETLALERAKLAETYRSEREAGIAWPDSVETVTDPILTPFVRAVISEGYRVKCSRGGCADIEVCPACRRPNRYTFVKDPDGAEIKRCAVCHH